MNPPFDYEVRLNNPPAKDLEPPLPRFNLPEVYHHHRLGTG